MCVCVHVFVYVCVCVSPFAMYFLRITHQLPKGKQGAILFINGPPGPPKKNKQGDLEVVCDGSENEV